MRVRPDFRWQSDGLGRQRIACCCRHHFQHLAPAQCVHSVSLHCRPSDLLCLRRNLDCASPFSVQGRSRVPASSLRCCAGEMSPCWRPQIAPTIGVELESSLAQSIVHGHCYHRKLFSVKPDKAVRIDVFLLMFSITHRKNFEAREKRIGSDFYLLSLGARI